MESAGFLMPLGSFILHISTEHLVHARHEGKHKRLSLSGVGETDSIHKHSHIPGCAVKKKNRILGKNDGRYTLERVGKGDVSGRVT